MSTKMIRFGFMVPKDAEGNPTPCSTLFRPAIPDTPNGSQFDLGFALTEGGAVPYNHVGSLSVSGQYHPIGVYKGNYYYATTSYTEIRRINLATGIDSSYKHVSYGSGYLMNPPILVNGKLVSAHKLSANINGRSWFPANVVSFYVDLDTDEQGALRSDRYRLAGTDNVIYGVGGWNGYLEHGGYVYKTFLRTGGNSRNVSLGRAKITDFVIGGEVIWEVFNFRPEDATFISAYSYGFGQGYPVFTHNDEIYVATAQRFFKLDTEANEMVPVKHDLGGDMGYQGLGNYQNYHCQLGDYLVYAASNLRFTSISNKFAGVPTAINMDMGGLAGKSVMVYPGDDEIDPCLIVAGVSQLNTIPLIAK